MTNPTPNDNLERPPLPDKKETKRKESCSHDEMADLIMKKFDFLTYNDSKEILYYDKSIGIYRSNGKELIQKHVEFEMAKKELSALCKNGFVNEVVGHIQRSTYMPRDMFNVNPVALTLKNGVLNINSLELMPHDKDLRSTIAIPLTYDAEAKCPAISKFFSEIVRPEIVPLLLEIFGWCMDKESTMQKLVMLIGQGSNGKSKILELLESFIGPENCSSVSLHQLTENRFSMAELYNKMVNKFGDLSSNSIKDVSNLKMLTGGDAIMAEKKFQDPFSFHNKAKLIFSTNKLPAMPDDNTAIWRRLILIDFPNQFMGLADDKHLLTKLTDKNELSGLLNLALQNLKSLKEKGEFSYATSIKDLRRNYLIKSAPAKVFVEEQCTQESDSWVSKEDMYQAFVKYCQENKTPAIGKNVFGRMLKSMDIVNEEQDKWYTHGWVGLKINQTN